MSTDMQVGMISQLAGPDRIAILREVSEGIANDKAADLVTARLAKLDELEANLAKAMATIKQLNESLATMGAENDRLAGLVKTEEQLQRRAAALDKRDAELAAREAKIAADEAVRKAERDRDCAQAQMNAMREVVGMFTRNPQWVSSTVGSVPMVVPGWTPPPGSGGYPTSPYVASQPVSVTNTVKAE
jgi:septal ring factor EnvC (AmiA/AmiB activator)